MKPKNEIALSVFQRLEGKLTSPYIDHNGFPVCIHDFKEVQHRFEKGRSFRLSRCTLCGLYEKMITRAGKIKSVYFSSPQ